MSGHPGRSWLSPDVRVGPSPVQGLGLFAAAPIPEGAVVMCLGGRAIGDAELAALTGPYDSLTVAEGHHLLLDSQHPARYGNHSCDPNLWHADAVTFVARRPIAVGEEVATDYATLTGVEGWSMQCRCGAAACRGVVTGRDWRLPALRAAYGGHWAPPLLERIRADT